MAKKENIDKIIQAKPEADKTDNNYRKSRMATRFPFKTHISVFTFQRALPMQNHFINMQVKKLKALKV